MYFIMIKSSVGVFYYDILFTVGVFYYDILFTVGVFYNDVTYLIIHIRCRLFHYDKIHSWCTFLWYIIHNRGVFYYDILFTVSVLYYDVTYLTGQVLYHNVKCEGIIIMKDLKPLSTCCCVQLADICTL